MKLKTKMVQYSDGMVCVSKGIDMQADREHDAAVAHALLQAMEQWGIDEFGVVDALKSRAAEIMAGWGYRE